MKKFDQNYRQIILNFPEKKSYLHCSDATTVKSKQFDVNVNIGSGQ